mmetsp:Transcript_31043/g.48599  ORF Transcript_31043/g.48599 Transcript_31043/m.48599 type:complete len:223 (-) Transcript_31043:404-1072(-)
MVPSHPAVNSTYHSPQTHHLEASSSHLFQLASQHFFRGEMHYCHQSPHFDAQSNIPNVPSRFQNRPREAPTRHLALINHPPLVWHHQRAALNYHPMQPSMHQHEALGHFHHNLSWSISTTWYPKRMLHLTLIHFVQHLQRCTCLFRLLLHSAIHEMREFPPTFPGGPIAPCFVLCPTFALATHDLHNDDYVSISYHLTTPLLHDETKALQESTIICHLHLLG